MHPRIDNIPEELLEQILGHVLTQPAADSTRPSWHTCKPPRNAPAVSVKPTVMEGSPVGRGAPLLVSHDWLRIATPLHYRHLVLRSERHLALLGATLRANPEFGRWVRSIRVDGVYDGLEAVVANCPELETFDMTIDDGAVSTASLAQVEDVPAVDVNVLNEKLLRFSASFTKMARLKYLVLRKTTYAYLTLPRTTLLFEKLSKAIPQWKSLQSIEIDFRFSPPASLAAFIAALTRAPSLRTVRTVLPSVWNPALLEICANPSLERIEFSSETRITDVHLYLAEARKHTRLFELIRAGTPLTRPRAHTMAVSRSPTPPAVVERASVRPHPVPTPQTGRPRGKLAPPARHVPGGRRMSAV